MSAYGLVTTLSIAICCNTAIRLESIHCALVAYGVKYVHLLATTLNIAVHCNTAIKLEFVSYVLMTRGQVFVCCSATTLTIVVCCYIAIRQESVCCMLAVIRLLPIDRAPHVEYLQSSV